MRRKPGKRSLHRGTCCGAVMFLGTGLFFLGNLIPPRFIIGPRTVVLFHEPGRNQFLELGFHPNLCVQTFIPVASPMHKRRKLDLDTQMADLSAERCLQAHRAGKSFSLEHPRNSIARRLRTWEALESEPGVFSTEYHACMFRGGRRRKAQVLIHNIKELEEVVGLTCQSSRLCSRTHQPHLPWKPRVVNGRVTSFATGEEREYPPGFCEAYATAVQKATAGKDSVFIEVFSGPNAPLSRAVAAVWGLQPPAPPEALPKGSEFERSETDTSIPGQVMPSEQPWMQQPVESAPYRASRVEAGAQPSYGKRTQLISDGLNSPSQHLTRAKTLVHPFTENLTLKATHRLSLEKIKEDPQGVIAHRFKTLDFLKKLKEECDPQQRRANLHASWTAVKLGTAPCTVLMSKLQELLGIEDREVPELCLRGMSITGRALCSPFFEDFEVPPVMSAEEFFSDLIPRSHRMVERVRFMGKKGSPELARAIWEKTNKEVASGTMGPAMTWEQVSAKYGCDFQVTPSFGLAQGLAADGTSKFRRIDDHTASGVNQCAHRLQKVPMTMVDYIGVMLKNLAAQSQDILMTTEDMKSAYRQVPLAPSDVRYAITGVYNPHTGEVDLHELYGQPFGAGHAVPNFCRVAEWINRCAQKLFSAYMDHFFDDFFVIEPRQTIQSALFCLQQLFQILGFSLDSEKSQPPSQLCAILGILFNTETLRTQRTISLCAKPSRIANLLVMIDQVRSSGKLTAALAASLVGKFSFLCSTLFGKVGRCCTGPIRRRQYSSALYDGLTQDIISALNLMRFFLLAAPSRELCLTNSPPVLVYTDASDVPGRAPQRVLGAVLYRPDTGELFYTSWAVPHSLVQKWLPKKSFMGQLELLAAPLAFCTWADLLETRESILFIDNDSAAANLVKGYSPQVDSSSIVGEFWLLASKLRAHMSIGWKARATLQTAPPVWILRR